MPSRLRPTASFAADAVLVGDPGRALLLAQELLEKPLMSNHSRGLWGYTGRTAAGDELTIQSTGIGAPSAAAVLVELAELGVRRAVRVGSAVATGDRAAVGDLIVVERALARGGSGASFGLEAGDPAEPDPALTASLLRALGEDGRAAAIASFDSMPPGREAGPDEVAADMQSAALLAVAGSRQVAAAVLMIVFEAGGSPAIGDEEREQRERLAGRVASRALTGA